MPGSYGVISEASNFEPFLVRNRSLGKGCPRLDWSQTGTCWIRVNRLRMRVEEPAPDGPVWWGPPRNDNFIQPRYFNPLLLLEGRKCRNAVEVIAWLIRLPSKRSSQTSFNYFLVKALLVTRPWLKWASAFTLVGRDTKQEGTNKFKKVNRAAKLSANGSQYDRIDILTKLI